MKKNLILATLILISLELCRALAYTIQACKGLTSLQGLLKIPTHANKAWNSIRVAWRLYQFLRQELLQ